MHKLQLLKQPSEVSEFVLSEDTNTRYGYDPRYLKSQSNVPVYVRCPSCSEKRLIKWQNYVNYGHSYCRSCMLGSIPGDIDGYLQRKRRNHKSRCRRLEDDLFRIKQNLRGNIRQALILRGHKITGLIRHLPYTPNELLLHIKTLYKEYHGQCPSCNYILDLTGFHIDHIIPLATANTIQDVIDLFALSNLDILCPSCNCSKKNKIFHIDTICQSH